MRTEFHIITRNIGYIYSYFYWISFITLFITFFASIIILMFTNMNTYSLYFYMFELILLFVFSIFCFTVSNYVEDVEYSEMNEKKPLIEVEKTRGDIVYESSEEEVIDWPELVGETIEYATTIITKDYPKVFIICLKENENTKSHIKNTVILVHNLVLKRKI